MHLISLKKQFIGDQAPLRIYHFSFANLSILHSSCFCVFCVWC